MIPLLLLLVGGGALAALWPRRAQRALSGAASGASAAAAAAAAALTEVATASAPNLTLEEGERFSDPVRAWLVRLALQVSGVPIYVTDGERTARDQAGAMLTKARRYDAALAAGQTPAQSDDLRWLYQQSADLISRLLASGRDLDTWTAMIQADLDAGHYVSRHLRAGAVDVRTRDRSPEDVAAIVAGVTALGGRALQESDHLHVDVPV